jgi:hypothetical protein
MGKPFQLKFSITDASQVPNSSLEGLNGAFGQAKRGPVGQNTIILNTPQDFTRIFGGETSSFMGPTLAKRYLSKGVSLRYARILAADATKALPTAGPKTVLLEYRALIDNTKDVAVTIGSTTITQAYTSSADATMTAFAAQIAADPQVSAATHTALL